MRPVSGAEDDLLYRSQCVEKFEADGRKRSRLGVAAYSDQDHGLFTAAATMKRVYLRLPLGVAVTENCKLRTRDATKHFVLSRTLFHRPVYMKAPIKMGVAKGEVLSVFKPVCGTPEAPMHWFKILIDYTKQNLNVKQTLLNPCLIFCSERKTTRCMIGIEADDIIYAQTEKFMDKKDQHSVTFPSKV